MPPVALNSFFSKTRTTSEVKAEVLSKCFEAWHSLHYSQLQQEETLLFADLLPDNPSEPENPQAQHPVLELLLQSSGRTVDLNATVRSFFYSTSAAGQQLQAAEVLHPPVLLQDTDSQQLFAELLGTAVPAFVLLNPLEGGYTSGLLLSALLPGHADSCLWFDAENLKQALGKGKAGKPLQDLLGEEAYAAAREFYRREKDSRKREDFFLPLLEKVLLAKGLLPLPFRVAQPDNGLPDRYLVLASRSKPTYRKLKELLLPYSDFQADGVPVFGANQHHQQQLLLFPELNRYSILNLMQDLQGKSALYHYKAIGKIAEEHSIATAYIPENYQLAFEKLRDQGVVQIINPKTMQPIKKSAPGSLVKFLAK